MDIDFLLRHHSNTPERLKEMLSDIISIDTGNDFVTFEIRSVSPISVKKKYTGVSASVVARIKNTRTVFTIDFGVGDIIVPNQEERRVPTQVSGFSAPLINTYSVESTIAEKLDAILSLMEFSSRMKDYYDIYFLANRFDFDGAVLKKALNQTFTIRARQFSVSEFERILGFYENSNMQSKWRAFTRKIGTDEHDFKTVLDTMASFLKEPYTSAVEADHFNKIWYSTLMTWTERPDN